MTLFNVFAALLKPGDIQNAPTQSANDFLVAGLNLTYFVAGVVAVIVIIIAGIMFVTNGGDPESVKKARNMILYSVIGLVVILIAFSATWFFIGRFQ